jgi:DNA mismatch repair protein MutL
MKEQIRILPEQLCNQIAAGEVVERPASVVKELVENALDAQASKIVIEIEGGGKRLIRITDNGCGMDREDAFLCLERHATSKLRSEADLFHLQTLGFRGEALPSIAAISRLRLRTRIAEALEGWEIQVDGGTVRHAEATGMPVGTLIEVRNLFFNTPARRKFLRRDETEAGHISDTITKLALACPQVQFQLLNNGRRQIDLNRQKNLTERVAGLLGRSVLKDLLPVEGSMGGMRLHGLISQPSLNRSATGSQFTFINGRYIRDRLVQHALRAGYRHLLLKGRHPIVVLFLEMAPEQVDVNVHPTKHEVRFRDQSVVHDFIVQALQETLRSAASPSSGPAFVRPAPVAGDKAIWPPPSRPLSTAEVVIEQPPAVGEGSAKYPAAQLEEINDAIDLPDLLSVAPLHEGGGYYASLRVIGQFCDSYLLCEDKQSLLLIDQHAAHERIGFEKLRAQYRDCGVERQGLLFPLVLDFDHREAASLEEHQAELQRFGFELERFGGNSFVLKGIPQILGDAEAEKLIRDVVAELSSFGGSSLVEERIEQLLVLMACHRVIRANQQLNRQEIDYLLQELDQVDFSGHCPHGRPVVQRLSLAEIERMFKRT